MAIQSMGSVLEQIQFQTQQISSAPRASAFVSDFGNDKTASFSELLFNSVNNINQTQVTAKTQSEAYLSGASDISLNDVMVSLQKSSIALNMGIQVRNKMVSAYQEIMNMGV